MPGDFHSNMQCQRIKANTVFLSSRGKKEGKPFTGQGFEVIAEGPKKYNAVKLHWCARCFC
jgi:hypothetical protein